MHVVKTGGGRCGDDLQGRRSLGAETRTHAQMSPHHQANPDWLAKATAAWRTGLLSNRDYLLLLNLAAGRSFNDLTQWPVFPWVLADYTSDRLDLDDPQSYR